MNDMNLDIYDKKFSPYYFLFPGLDILDIKCLTTREAKNIWRS